MMETMNAPVPFNYKNLMRDFVGFDSLFDSIFNTQRTLAQSGFPPYSIYTEEVGEEKTPHWFVKLALAGIPKEQVKATFKGNMLTIWNEKPETEVEANRKYLYNGIAERQFKFEKRISSDLEFVKAEWKDGCLVVEFKSKEKTPEDEGFLQIE
jgi:molecular chaperone IbpA